MATGSTSDFTLTRDQLIQLSHKIIGVLEPGQVLDGDQLQDGIDLLNLIVRETDAAGKWRWTMGEASLLTLAKNVHRYDSNNGLPTNIAELDTVFYRDANGKDWPLNIYKAETYEAIPNKLEANPPKGVYLTETIALASRVLFVWPMLSAVKTGSVVTGTDSNAYTCIYPHEAAAENRPITGANYKMMWKSGGSGAVAWVSGTDYINTEQLRLVYRRPIFDFDTASDTPDFPIQWPRLLVYKLAFDLGDLYTIPLEERKTMIQKAKGSFDDVFPSTKAKSTTKHSKAKYF